VRRGGSRSVRMVGFRAVVPGWRSGSGFSLGGGPWLTARWFRAGCSCVRSASGGNDEWP